MTSNAIMTLSCPTITATKKVVTVLLEEPNKLYIQDIRKGLQVSNEH